MGGGRPRGMWRTFWQSVHAGGKAVGVVITAVVAIVTLAPLFAGSWHWAAHHRYVSYVTSAVLLAVVIVLGGYVYTTRQEIKHAMLVQQSFQEKSRTAIQERDTQIAELHEEVSLLQLEPKIEDVQKHRAVMELLGPETELYKAIFQAAIGRSTLDEALFPTSWSVWSQLARDGRFFFDDRVQAAYQGMAQAIENVFVSSTPAGKVPEEFRKKCVVDADKLIRKYYWTARQQGLDRPS